MGARAQVRRLSHARRLDRGDVHLLTRTGLDWTGKYPAIAAVLRKLLARQAYLDGELSGVRPDGITSFALIQNAAERQEGDDLAYFVFDPLHCDGQDLMPLLLDVAPPRSTRFGSLLVLSWVHWVRPELVVEVKYLSWTEDGLLRQVLRRRAGGQAGARGCPFADSGAPSQFLAEIL